MDKQKSASTASRFNAGTTANRQQTAARPASRPADNIRRPSGFGTAGQKRKAAPAPEPETKKASKIKPEKIKKEKRIREEHEPGKNRPLLRILLGIIAAVVLISLLMVLIFGGEDTTYHQMPTIEYESIAQFEPEATPIPGTEGL